jgi:hypothetical protein
MAPKKPICCPSIEFHTHNDDKSPHHYGSSHIALRKLTKNELAGQIIPATNNHHMRSLVARKFSVLLKLTNRPRDTETFYQDTEDVDYFWEDKFEGEKNVFGRREGRFGIDQEALG